jgi:hypothetical protein
MCGGGGFSCLLVWVGRGGGCGCGGRGAACVQVGGGVAGGLQGLGVILHQW